ncbi:MAG: helix-turn-helix domain-containing protein [Pyrinomonadaceae bacterium]
MSKEFILRLNEAFDNESMADVARRLKIPHATVRNYYQGRLPAPDVLIKIAKETGVSLNWLLIGTGDTYAGQVAPIGLGKFIEEKIGQIVDQKLAAREFVDIQDLGTADGSDVFDVEAAVLRLNDPERVMSEWLRHEGRDYPQDYSVVFFNGWETFSPADKVAAVRDAKRVFDRSLAG